MFGDDSHAKGRIFSELLFHLGDDILRFRGICFSGALCAEYKAQQIGAEFCGKKGVVRVRYSADFDDWLAGIPCAQGFSHLGDTLPEFSKAVGFGVQEAFDELLCGRLVFGGGFTDEDSGKSEATGEGRIFCCLDAAFKNGAFTEFVDKFGGDQGVDMKVF